MVNSRCPNLAAPAPRSSGAALYASAGWGGVCILGSVTALLALGVWAVTEATRDRARRSEARTAVCAGAGD